MTSIDEIRQQLDLLNDEELISILREHDEEQWRPEVFGIVASILRGRGVSPVTDPEDEEEIVDEPAGANLITVASYFNYVDAETDRLALEAKGLRAWIFNKYSPQAIGPLGAVQLKVREEDLPAAMRILDSEPASPSDLPDEIAEPPCPKCGSREVSKEPEIVESFDGLSGSTGPSPRHIWLCRCASCGYKWSGS